jgi:hypothetical protein
VTFKIVGLDWFEVVAQVAVTIAVGVALDSMFPGSAGDVTISLWVAASVVVLGIRRKRALMAEAAGPADSARLGQLEDRVAELEAQHGRIYELEERLDFAERLLSQQRDMPRLPGA